MEITDFKKGDIITRIEPITIRRGASGFLMGNGIDMDYSSVGRKYQYVGIANGIIYCACKESDKDRIEFYLSKDKDGWDYWMDPNTL